ncbi:MAG: transcriptional regulator [Prevotella sp.]|uniref:transcriptional regulator n=1 Tax=Prevotella sp. TaxID=59823 RepID=UPI002A252095|nr:transcriptional regulator [Prevotella sp.]MDD7317914.1 transcriptional regulator [Prevotellaceae bacterium]MDY4020805.1 transcriptional regulator [Prevotella sp.]
MCKEAKTDTVSGGSDVVRWYVLTLPYGHRSSPSAGLQAELERREKSGEEAFEYFAPSYTEAKSVRGKMTKTSRPLLFNYVFVHASEAEIYKMKCGALHRYNFLPRVREGNRQYYPYLTERAMENLRWVARAYGDVLPVYIPEPDKLMKGDRVRITEGQFMGTEATVMIQPGAGQKNVMVCVEDWLWVPLLQVKQGQYEVVALNESGNHVYTKLNNDRLFREMHEAVIRYHSAGGVTAADRKAAQEILNLLGNLEMPTPVLRCKHYSLLLPATLVLDRKEEAETLLRKADDVLSGIKAEQAAALLLTTLYGCTRQDRYRLRAQEIVKRWEEEDEVKKGKRMIIYRFIDYNKHQNETR